MRSVLARLPSLNAFARPLLQEAPSSVDRIVAKSIMTTAEVLNPPPAVEAVATAHNIEMTLAASSLLGESAAHAHDNSLAKRSWRADAGRISAMLDLKMEPQDVVMLDTYVQPVDRGPGALDARQLARSWQYHVTGKAAAAQALAELKTEHIKNGGVLAMQAEATRFIAERKLDDTFYMVDLGNVLRMYKAWRAAMPRVIPFYAIKCNPEPGILKLLAALGTGFDCASKGELDQMLKMGVHPSRIIFAHPCKRACDIRYAKEHNVQYTTFDTESELYKVAEMNPDFKLVFRMRADDPDARVPLGLKYGAEVDEAPRLLRIAKQLGLNVVGVSFHVGSACKNLATFTGAIEKARQIFDQAEDLGFAMELLDMGGGFTGHFDAHGNVMFGDIATTLNTAIAAHFPPETGVRIIAEPGRYFAETSSVLVTPVYGQRNRKDAVTGAIKKDYWITDGLYGSFNCILYDGQNPECKVLRSPLLPEVAEEEAPVTSTIWGPTCDSADCVYKDIPMPKLRNGDFLLWPNAGAYTVAGACDFNGIEFTTPKKFYVFSDSAVDAVEEGAEADTVAEEATA